MSCLKCNDPNNNDCTDCSSPFILNSNMCECPSSQYQSGGSCASCDPRCNECDGPGNTNCNTCQFGGDITNGSSCMLRGFQASESSRQVVRFETLEEDETTREVGVWTFPGRGSLVLFPSRLRCSSLSPGEYYNIEDRLR